MVGNTTILPTTIKVDGVSVTKNSNGEISLINDAIGSDLITDDDVAVEDVVNDLKRSRCIGSIELSSASSAITFDNLPDVQMYKVLIHAKGSNDNFRVNLMLNNDSGLNYSYSLAYLYTGTTQFASSQSNFEIALPKENNFETTISELTITKAIGGGYHNLMGLTMNEDQTGQKTIAGRHNGSTDAISRIDISGSGNLLAGTTAFVIVYEDL